MPHIVQVPIHTSTVSPAPSTSSSSEKVPQPFALNATPSRSQPPASHHHNKRDTVGTPLSNSVNGGGPTLPPRARAASSASFSAADLPSMALQSPLVPPSGRRAMTDFSNNSAASARAQQANFEAASSIAKSANLGVLDMTTTPLTTSGGGGVHDARLTSPVQPQPPVSPNTSALRISRIHLLSHSNNTVPSSHSARQLAKDSKLTATRRESSMDPTGGGLHSTEREESSTWICLEKIEEEADTGVGTTSVVAAPISGPAATVTVQHQQQGACSQQKGALDDDDDDDDDDMEAPAERLPDLPEPSHSGAFDSVSSPPAEDSRPHPHLGPQMSSISLSDMESQHPSLDRGTVDTSRQGMSGNSLRNLLSARFLPQQHSQQQQHHNAGGAASPPSVDSVAGLPHAGFRVGGQLQQQGGGGGGSGKKPQKLQRKLSLHLSTTNSESQRNNLSPATFPSASWTGGPSSPVNAVSGECTTNAGLSSVIDPRHTGSHSLSDPLHGSTRVLDHPHITTATATAWSGQEQQLCGK